ncbi:Spy/CpxP family protein refolding chaperone [Shewanella sp. OMA3-2]|uniref:Spy/CpxP family protein refolding chaperone n=1 Tax=Shewanella sp. OMA3-2 TaxID=2908650 RepID=UPI001F1FA458|nr:Spy/CpxP family protein refolding chaperone [Shewanella sp. OMA3-2]UJF22449.1 Spy/CpxP family protein refolding chaperone [Shewanella sp. OMA3-2]
MKPSSILKTSLVALVASSALLTGQLYATDTTGSTVHTEQVAPKGDRQHGHKGGMHKMLGALELTDEQKVQVKAIFGKYKANRPERPTKEQRATHKAEMLALITTAGFDEAKATEMAEAKQQLQLQKMLTHLKMQNEIYQLLTPEQQQKFQDRFNSGKGHASRH